MIKIILTGWTFLMTVAVIGWGAGLARILMGAAAVSEPDAKFPLPQLFLVGTFAITSVALLTNFFLPLTIYSGIPVTFLGLGLAIANFRSLAADLRTIGLIIVGTVWVVYGLPYDGLFNDAGLYHLQFEQWIAHSPALAGLANIQHRFGFDSMWLMFVSACRIDIPSLVPIWTHAILADMLIRTFVFWWVLLILTNAIGVGDKFSSILFILVFAVISLLLWRLRAAGVDVPPNLLAVCLWLLLYEVLLLRRIFWLQLVAALCVAALLFTFKLSIFPTCFLVLPIVYVFRREFRLLLLMLTLVCGYVSLWLVRNLLLSGCLIFPVSITCLNVPWGVGSAYAQEVSHGITVFARQHLGPNLQAELPSELLQTLSLSWLGVWVKKFIKTFYFHIIVASWSIGFVASFVLRGTGLILRNNIKFFLMSTGIVGCLSFLYWLVLAPDPRFSWVAFFLLSVTGVGVGFRNLAVKSQETIIVRSNSIGYILIFCVFIASVVLGVTRGSSINFEQYRFYGYANIPYMWEVFRYRGIDFYKSVGDECGDRYPCVENFDPISLDKFLLRK